MSELTKALIQFQKDVDKIEKNARANYGKFADLANVLSTVTPALNKNGLALTQTFLDDALITTLHHEGGETIHSSCKLVVCDGRNNTQEWGKAVTYQRRFSICSILGIVADMDTDDVPDLPPSNNAPAAKKASSKPANSAAFNAGAKVIQAAKDLAALQTLSKRVAERNEKKDFKPGEYEQLVEMLKNREAQIKEHQQ
jgi:mRNA-degrading endonuclease YafQ of YafQ-DinJ toxin-antitoxin module